MGEIVFADSDEMSDLEPTVINVVQKGLDVYEPVAPEEGNDIQLFPQQCGKVMVVCPVEIMMQLSIMI